MLVMPAVDLREGQCVQLVGGSYDREEVRLPAHNRHRQPCREWRKEISALNAAMNPPCHCASRW